MLDHHVAGLVLGLSNCIALPPPLGRCWQEPIEGQRRGVFSFTVPTRLLHPSNLHSSDRLGSCPCVEHYVLHLFSMHVSLMFSADETKHISSSSNGFLKEHQSRCVAVDWPSSGNKKKCLCPPSGCMTRLFGTDHRGTARLGIRIGIISLCILLLVPHVRVYVLTILRTRRRRGPQALCWASQGCEEAVPIITRTLKSRLSPNCIVATPEKVPYNIDVLGFGDFRPSRSECIKEV